MANSKIRKALLGALVGLTGAVAALGCGGSNGAGVPDYIGTWSYTQQQGTLSCPGQMDASVTLGTTKDLREGVTSDIVDVSSICNYRFDIKDKVAAIQSGQTCNFDDGAGGTVTEVPSNWTFTLTSATTAEEKFTTVATLSDLTMCSFSGLATLKRLTKD